MSSATSASRLKIVAVLGGGEGILEKIRKSDPARGQRYIDQAKALGAWLAERNVHLLTGGGGGLMAAVSEGFHKGRKERRGLVLGVIPGPELKDGYPNRWVEIPILTHLPGDDPRSIESRNHINVLTGQVIIALPGGGGTRAEIELACQRYGKRVAVYLEDKNDTIGGLDVEALRRAGYEVFQEAGEVHDFVKSGLS